MWSKAFGTLAGIVVLCAVSQAADDGAHGDSAERCVASAPAREDVQALIASIEQDGFDAVQALVLLGDRHTMGAYIERDYPAAMDCYGAAAQRGYAPAMIQLGKILEGGHGIGTFYAKAAEWYSRAAELGEPEAQFRYARLLMRGQGVRRDMDAAELWLEKAAALRHPLAVDALLKIRATR